MILNFKAAILEKNNSPLTIKKINFSGNLKRGQVLVKLKFTGICGKQIDEIKGIGGKDPYLPHLLGHEGSGVVLKVGPSVKKVKKNDKVVLHWIKSTGIQSATPKYTFNKKIINAGWVTTFNEYSIVSENRLTKIPNNYSLKKASLFGCCASTSLGLVFNKLHLKKNDTLLVIGIGGLGQIIIQAARIFKFNNLIAADINPKALKKAKKLGANILVNLKKKNDLNKIKNLSINKSVVTTGNIKAIETASNLLSIPGQCFIMGVPPRKKTIKINAWNLMHNQSIEGCLGGNSKPFRDIPKFIKLDKNKLINLENIIYKVINFKNINKGIKMFQGKSTGRIIVKF